MRSRRICPSAWVSSTGYYALARVESTAVAPHQAPGTSGDDRRSPRTLPRPSWPIRSEGGGVVAEGRRCVSRHTTWERSAAASDRVPLTVKLERFFLERIAGASTSSYPIRSEREPRAAVSRLDHTWSTDPGSEVRVPYPATRWLCATAVTKPTENDRLRRRAPKRVV